MTTLSSHVDNAKQHLADARHRASPFVEKFARFGYAAKGVVYCVVGAMAALAAIGGRGAGTTGSRGALQSLAEQPFGQVLLGIVAFGLAGYSLWQFIRAIEDPEGEGSDGKAIAKRIGFFGSGVIHLGLVVFAIGIITGAATGSAGDGSGDHGAQSWSARAMSYPLGQWLVGLIGAGIVIYGLAQLRRAFRGDLDKRLHLGQLSDTARRPVMTISRIGLAARGIVFGVVGIFLALAAYRANPSEARGIGGALRALQEQPYGPWLLAAVALGLIAYGIYEFVLARYRRISPE